MGKQLLEFGKQLVTLTGKVQQHEADIKELQQELKDMRQELRALSQAVQEMRFERSSTTATWPRATAKTWSCVWKTFCCATSAGFPQAAVP